MTLPGRQDRGSLAARVHAALPQTQCTRCGYADCAGYAEAIASSDAPINQCPPGGAEGIARLAALTGRPELPLNPLNGSEGPRYLAVIDEAWCIGCTLCIDACPTDAILGSNKRMHTVVEPYCTGCELCLPACPVDCIGMVNLTGVHSGWQAWSAEKASEALARYESRRQRERRGAPEPAPGVEPKRGTQLADPPAGLVGADHVGAERKQAVIAAALEKARVRRGSAQ